MSMNMLHFTGGVYPIFKVIDFSDHNHDVEHKFKPHIV